jgi:hypothetical protein
MGTFIIRMLRFIPIALKYAVQYAPAVYELGVWVRKIYSEWRKKPETTDPSGADACKPPVDAKPDPG